MGARARGTDLILHGVSPGELPIVIDTDWEIIVNLKAATKLGLGVASTVLDRATKLI